MVLFSLKLLNNLRKAIAGRRFPHQLAGGVALGVLLGIIPHGNLLALFVLVAVLCFRVNHALMATVAILVSFSATRLDSYSHSVGETLLTHPTGHRLATQAWELPVMPWTDLNNTVVLGSFVIGLAAVLPIYFATLPIFRLVAPAESDETLQGESDKASDSSAGQADCRSDDAHDLQSPQRLVAEAATQSRPSETDKHSVSLYVDQQEDVPPPRFSSATQPSASQASTNTSDATTIPIDRVLASQTEFVRADAGAESNPAAANDALPSNEQMVSVDTRIDVIRIKDFRKDDPAAATTEGRAENETGQPMDEALNYLLRQLRHSQERKAAG